MTKYYKDALKLAISIVPKSTSVAVSMNIALSKRYPGVKNLYDTKDKSTWIYYQNLRGERFTTRDGVILQPEVMFTPIETGEPIIFNRANLELYNLTRVNLETMGVLYKSITDSYPGQELRIRSILFGGSTPVDGTTYKDGSILLANKNYVEDNEYMLLTTLEKRIQHYLARWDIKDYILGDEEYASILLLRLTQFIFLNIINIRKDNINTLEVHSYHMKNYFDSNLRLSNVTNVLEPSVKFWLYKNLSTIMFEMGTNKTLDTIINNILEPSNIEVSLFNIHPIKPDWDNKLDGIYNKDRIYDRIGNNISLENMLTMEKQYNPDFVYSDTGYRDDIFKHITRTSGEVENTKAILLKEKRDILLGSNDISIIILESMFSYLSRSADNYTVRDEDTGISYVFRSADLIYVILYILGKISNKDIKVLGGLVIHNLLTPMVFASSYRSSLIGDDTLTSTVDSINGLIGDITTISNKEDINTYIDNMVLAHTRVKYLMGNIGSSKTKDVMQRLYNTSAVVENIVLDPIDDIHKYMLDKNILIVDSNDRDINKWVKLLNTISNMVVGKNLMDIDSYKLDTFVDMVNKLTSYSTQILKDDTSNVSGTLINTIGYHYDISAMSVVDVSVKCGNGSPTITDAIGTDGKLFNTIFETSLTEVTVEEPPDILINTTSPLSEHKINMTVV